MIPAAGQSSLQTERMLECRECKGSYGEDFFELALGKSTYPKLRKLRCIGCRLTRRTNEKNNGQRCIVKARNAVMTHARTLARKGIVHSAADLVQRFGWDLHAMAHDIEHAFANSCPYCRRPFHEMANGLGEVTLDIVDPKDQPYYVTNTKWCCETCNRAKSKTDPRRWAKKLLWWAEWRRQQVRLRENQSLVTPLFGGDVQGIPI